MKITLEINEVYAACRKALNAKAGLHTAALTDDDFILEVEDDDGNEIVIGDIRYVATVAD